MLRSVKSCGCNYLELLPDPSSVKEDNKLDLKPLHGGYSISALIRKPKELMKKLLGN